MLISKDIKNKEIIKPLLRGRDIDKWKINYANLYLIYSYDGLNIEEKYPVIYKYLCQFHEQLEKRYDKGGKWYNLRVCSYDDLFEKEKIIYGEIVPEPRFVYDNHKFYVEGTGFLLSSSELNLKYILALLNSKLLFWYFKDIGYNLGGKGFRYKKIFIEQLPIKFTDEKRINKLVDEQLTINEKQAIEETNFKKWLKTSFQIDKLSNKLENYYELTFEEFLKELSKS